MNAKKCKKRGCYSDGVCKDGRCPMHTYAAKEIRDYSSSGRGSGPKTNLPCLGVELECFATNDMILRALRSQHKTPHHDGSINNLGCEFKVCLPADKAITWVPRFAERLASLGARVDSSCGLHVHLDARNILLQHKMAFIQWLSTWETFWFSLTTPSRRPGGDKHQYCKTITNNYQNNHYVWANRMHQNTIEIRIHGGTLNKHKITGWLSAMADLLDLLRSQVPLPLIENQTPTEEQLHTIFKRPLAYEYIMDRKNAGGVLASSYHYAPSGPEVEAEASV